MFGGFEPRRSKDIKGIMAPEIGPKVSGLFRNRPLARCGFREMWKGETCV